MAQGILWRSGCRELGLMWGLLVGLVALLGDSVLEMSVDGRFVRLGFFCYCLECEMQGWCARSC